MSRCQSESAACNSDTYSNYKGDPQNKLENPTVTPAQNKQKPDFRACTYSAVPGTIFDLTLPNFPYIIMAMITPYIATASQKITLFTRKT